MSIRAILIVSAVLFAPLAGAANTPPLSGAWSIVSTGTAASSGELLFRVTPSDGEGATEVTVFVLSGSNDMSVASNIRRALNSQLRADKFNVEPGQGANVLLTSQAKDFSLELIDSDVENVRVTVQSTTPVAPPTVPRQAAPANAPRPATPPAHGDALPPPAVTEPPANTSEPAVPPPDNGPPLPDASPPPNTPGGDGAPARAPPPPGG